MTEKIAAACAVQPVQQKNERNQSIECFRVLASILIVLLHFRLPGSLGEVMACLARLAVPFFFAVSGYFVYQADETVILKRINGIVKLNIYSTLLYLLWKSYLGGYIFNPGWLSWLREILSKENLAKWVINCINPFAGHLWYLTAVLVCYLVLYLYVRWMGNHYDYYSLYIIGVLLYAVHVALDSLAAATGFAVPYQLCRNALFLGIPMFVLGIFLREYQHKINETYRLSRGRLAVIIIAGTALSLLEWQGTGCVEMPIGTLFQVIALMLLLTSTPRIFKNNVISSVIIPKLGELSLYTYVTHLLLGDICKLRMHAYIPVLGEKVAEYMLPISIILLSVFTGSIWILVKDIVKKILFARK